MVSNVEMWARFREVATVRFTATSHTGTGWNGSGVGVVEVSQPAPNTLLWHESGAWQQEGGGELRFNNVFRWSLGQRLRLEHLRRGEGHPVFLFEMAADTDGIWRETSPHLCGEDRYHASLSLENGQVLLGWRVLGRKREAIDYIYA